MDNIVYTTPALKIKFLISKDIAKIAQRVKLATKKKEIAKKPSPHHHKSCSKNAFSNKSEILMETANFVQKVRHLMLHDHTVLIFLYQPHKRFFHFKPVSELELFSQLKQMIALFALNTLELKIQTLFVKPICAHNINMSTSMDNVKSVRSDWCQMKLGEHVLFQHSIVEKERFSHLMAEDAKNAQITLDLQTVEESSALLMNVFSPNSLLTEKVSAKHALRVLLEMSQ